MTSIFDETSNVFVDSSKSADRPTAAGHRAPIRRARLDAAHRDASTAVSRRRPPTRSRSLTARFAPAYARSRLSSRPLTPGRRVDRAARRIAARVVGASPRRRGGGLAPGLPGPIPLENNNDNRDPKRSASDPRGRLRRPRVVRRRAGRARGKNQPAGAVLDQGGRARGPVQGRPRANGHGRLPGQEPRGVHEAKKLARTNLAARVANKACMAYTDCGKRCKVIGSQ
ncbi:hypothetical protein BBK_3089 [Burkholderia pseudomallei NCTC 13179]|nr:hypothetical protein BBK_3089 [Burkholderia pseudomallei NCTC 13179]